MREARSSPRARGRERGSAVVEFGLVLPILLLIALALLQVGMLARDQLLVTQAARAAAREAAVQAETVAVERAASEAAPGLAPERVSVTVSRGAGFGEPVAVTVTYAVQLAAPLAGWLFPEQIVLHSEATMRQEFG